MRRLAGLLLLGLIIVTPVLGAAGEPSPFDYPIKALYSAASEDSVLVYKVPIEVKVLDVAEDLNWYKVRLSFILGPINYVYTGWTKIPVGDLVSASEDSVYSFNVPIKELRAAPAEDSKLVFSVPIEVKVLDVSLDANWYKVKIAYSFGPFCYTYVGWTRVPVGDTFLAEKNTLSQN